MFLYYGGNNYTSNEKKKGLLVPAEDGTLPLYKRTPAFYGWEKRMKPASSDILENNPYGFNPFSAFFEGNYYPILSSGPGWHMPLR